MSMTQLVATVTAALKDGAVGVSAKTAALAAGDARIRSDFNFTAWALETPLKPVTAPIINVRPRTWTPLTKAGDVGHRDALATLEISYEYFGGVLLDIQDNLSIVATALAQSLDELRAYSDAHGGTVIEVNDGSTYQFGPFGPSSNGFIATITVQERSTQ